MSFELNLQCFPVVPRAIADFTRYGDIWQELHLDLRITRASARFAPTAADIEGESARRVTARLGLWHRCEQGSHGGEQAGVSRGIGSRSATNGRLVYVNHLVNVVQPVNLIVVTRSALRAVEVLCETLEHYFVD